MAISVTQTIDKPAECNNRSHPSARYISVIKVGLVRPHIQTGQTYAAAFFLTLLNQMLRVLGLSTALQFVAFGVAIVAGMIVSGDRIITFVENILQHVVDPLSTDSDVDVPVGALEN